MIIHMVFSEERDPIGRIVQEIDSAYLRWSNAALRRRLINSDPERFPGKVADIESIAVRDADIRATPSDRGYRSKLNPEQVTAIRARFAAGDISMSALGREYGVATQTVSDIISGRTWRS